MSRRWIQPGSERYDVTPFVCRACGQQQTQVVPTRQPQTRCVFCDGLCDRLIAGQEKVERS